MVRHTDEVEPETLAEDFRDVGATADAYTKVDPLVVVERGDVPDDRVEGMADAAGYTVFARDADEYTLIDTAAYEAKVGGL